MLSRLVVIAAVPVALGFAGCAKQIDEKDIESKIAENIAQTTGGQKPKIDCPGGQDAKKGNRFNCTATIGGNKATVIVTLTSDDGRFTFQLKQT